MVKLIKYRGERLWVKIKLVVASVLWGLLVALIAVVVTERLTGPIQTLVRVVIFLLGFTALEISAENVDAKGNEIV